MLPLAVARLSIRTIVVATSRRPDADFRYLQGPHSDLLVPLQPQSALAVLATIASARIPDLDPRRTVSGTMRVTKIERQQERHLLSVEDQALAPLPILGQDWHRDSQSLHTAGPAAT